MCLENFYQDESDARGGFSSTASNRREALAQHLQAAAHSDFVLVGEAAGWRGCRQSGIPFTSPCDVGLTGTREASASVVQSALASTGLAPRVLLWNALPLHPHPALQYRQNRTPTAAEVRLGHNALLAALTQRRVICVGTKAARAVSEVTQSVVPGVYEKFGSGTVVQLRHPSFGGASRFRAGFDLVAEAWA
ncbi:uracil-DNA glycosylase [Pseudoclavibacter sp. VKM Ac-2888]|uniref:uracil-DNA glycosylase n=1 Tax=Pseudoclavibacter sp. VKM Ac-2888 TaxID=2783830 RepID=UPI00188B9764|nr:uracil-DNA glycosylase [Pseudoclavibacter sp. VKM Ac-2888]